METDKRDDKDEKEGKEGKIEKMERQKGKIISKQQKQRNIREAYFTLEASLILPMAIGVVLLVAYLLVFQYDRCLLDMNMGTIAIYTSEQKCENAKDRVALAEQKVRGMYKDHYAAWKWNTPIIEERKNRLSISESGILLFPFKGMSFWSNDDEWEYAKRVEVGIFHRAALLRSYRRIQDFVQ